ncbi:ATP-binding cassette domain-containing protein [Alloiococcus sp. CFN-8]|uniref:ABC transporter ATP-binding protein/permease n=1 Tax=Alloiococcus sp. CFN-8 TaxID=3416081 RepID=UPI003CFB50FC
MLTLANITKEYRLGDNIIKALKGINIKFRKNEFVSILGPSGCGKTTLLNIVGGLDKYTNGDLTINGTSTKEYKDRDWDTYRNHSVGFVFQSYNLIPHQKVLSNVELALTLSGVSKEERRKRAIEVLEQVGLGDQIHKKPNQMSGGQMQRVSIARALINDPDILLADEPTGALDTQTSLQIMKLLKEIAEDRLIIMVTHNPELAEKYSTRIIKLLDGKVIDDTNPYIEDEKEYKESSSVKSSKTSMSFFTALSLSLTNLLTKKTRTFMTAFAGSIGIIGIALILALSTGFQNYINKVEEDTLSSYPITIEEESVDMSSLINTMMGMSENNSEGREPNKIYSNDVMGDMLSSLVSDIESNNLQAFKEYIENEDNGLENLTSTVQYGYNTTLNIYKADTSQGIVQVNPSTVMENIGMGAPTSPSAVSSPMMGGGNADVWEELFNNEKLLKSQYELLEGSWPSSYDEVVLIVDENNQISDMTLYSLGLKDQEELKNMMKAIEKDEEIKTEEVSYSFEDLLKLTYKLVLNTDYYTYNQENGSWKDNKEDEIFMKNLIDDSLELKVVGILKPSKNSEGVNTNGSIGYRPDLMEYAINSINESEIVKAQKANPDTDVFTGKPFEDETSEGDEESTFDMSTLSPEEQAYMSTLSEEELQLLIKSYEAAMVSDATYEENLSILGVADLSSPNRINLYAADFEAKEAIADKIAEYNKEMTSEGKDTYVINYTDYVGLMMSSVSNIINTITYVLISFVAISLVVSSIMIGIITYISVLERTKEIGILRSIGASKRDISRVFNAETLIIGFVSGALGILTTLLLTIPINAIIENIVDVPNVATLPLNGAITLILISMSLTLIAGLIPSKIASRKDPAVALRTE